MKNRLQSDRKPPRNCCDGHCTQGCTCPQVDNDLTTSGLLAAAILGATLAVLFALFVTFLWLR